MVREIDKHEQRIVKAEKELELRERVRFEGKAI